MQSFEVLFEQIRQSILFGNTSGPDPIVAIGIQKGLPVLIKKKEMETYDPREISLDISSIASPEQLYLVSKEIEYLRTLSPETGVKERMEDLHSLCLDFLSEEYIND
jgi:hypothetical protein